ncbi:MAG: secondary thiamine-phosphate synthase enzyme YjbQ [Bacteroidales bacterium]|nr:secondary thiamine-phosphate synthase enzyme YjbQ [Bacteroidales bacterium]
MVQQIEIVLPSFNRGFHLITHLIEDQLPSLPEKGILNVFIQHTSAGLTINENADPTVRTDFETVFNKLVPEGASYYIHTFEGLDDMPAHIKSSLVGQSITIPITNHRLNLGTWQGIYLCEFRNRGGRRRLMATIYY